MFSEGVALNLDLVSEPLRDQARHAFETGNACGFVCTVSNTDSMALVVDNLGALQARGIYEACLISAYTGTRTNLRGWDQRVIVTMFSLADRDRLRAAGCPLPCTGPLTLYRGIAGRGPARRTRGISWTASLPSACWFAARYPHLENPAVVSVTVSASEVLCYTNDRKEEEFILMPPEKVRRLRLSPEQLAEHAARRLQEKAQAAGADRPT